MHSSRFRGALPSVVAFAFSAALEFGDFRSPWLSVLLAAAGTLLLIAWAIPFFWREWEAARSELHLERMSGIPQVAAIAMYIEPDGAVGARATVSGRMWFQRDVVLDNIYVSFQQSRRLVPWLRREVIRAEMNEDARALAGMPEFEGWRVDAGNILRFDQALFSAWPTTPRTPARHGKFRADLYVDLLVPYRSVRLDLGEEEVNLR